MSDLNKILDLSMFGCPLHKTKALAAAEQLIPGQVLRLKINNDAVNTVTKHLTDYGFTCQIAPPDVLTTVVEVTKHD
jgi:TusA-related sulfurtransferase